MSTESRSFNIGWLTVVAALVTGAFTFFAAKQTLRVEVTLPDKGEETFSIKAASNKIEELSRKLTLAEGEIASLRERVSSEAKSNKVDSLLRRIKTLEEELRSKERLISDLNQQAGLANHEARSPLTGDSSEHAEQAKQEDSATFYSRVFELEVISVEPTPEEITLVAEIRPRTDEPLDFLLNIYNTFVLDAAGNRWGGLTKTRDTLGAVHANKFQSIELLPGTAVRSRFRFEADVLASERPPDPQPPFTFVAEEMNHKQRIVVEALDSK